MALMTLPGPSIPIRVKPTRQPDPLPEFEPTPEAEPEPERAKPVPPAHSPEREPVPA